MSYSRDNKRHSFDHSVRVAQSFFHTFSKCANDMKIIPYSWGPGKVPKHPPDWQHLRKWVRWNWWRGNQKVKKK